MVDVNEIIRLTEERSNDIDIVATIKNSFENFYDEDLKYPFVEVDNHCPENIVNEIRETQEDYKLGQTIDKTFLEEVFKHLKTGIFIAMATVKIENDKVYIKSTENYEYSLYEIGYTDKIQDKNGNLISTPETYDVVYGIFIEYYKNNFEIGFKGDFLDYGPFAPLFYFIQDINEANEHYKFNTNNPIVQKVVEAIYNGIIFY